MLNNWYHTKMSRIVLFNKPYGVLSQFTDGDGHPGLAHYIPLKGYYPAGRLDRDSEGLLILTNDGKLQAQISNPRFKTTKTYWAQVEGAPSEAQLQQLCQGVALKDGMTLPAKVREIPEPVLWPRDPPIRYRKSIPTSWIELQIREGRNRQVRRMTAAVGLPTLRLVRSAIGSWTLGKTQPGAYRLEEFRRKDDNYRHKQPKPQKPYAR